MGWKGWDDVDGERQKERCKGLDGGWRMWMVVGGGVLKRVWVLANGIGLALTFVRGNNQRLIQTSTMI
jgi:hypothetical protein